MLTIQLLSLGLLVHESVYLSSRGIGHFGDGLCPVLGVSLSRRQRYSLHLCFVGCVILLGLFPRELPLRWVTLLMLSVLMAAFPRRLPNHLPVAWTILAGFCVTSEAGTALGVAQFVVLATYLLAAVHKLNRDVFHRRQSCGSGLILEYLLKRGIPIHREGIVLYVAGTFAVVAAEASLPVLLVVKQTVLIGIVLATLMHIAFGIIGHPHFSIIMMAGLMAFAPIYHSAIAVEPLTIAVVIFVSVVVTRVVSIDRIYRHRAIAWLNTLVVVTVGLLICVSVFVRQSRAAPLWVGPAWEGSDIAAALMLAYVINGASPYLGIKHDFSLAMFSGLHPLRENHLFLPISRLSLRPKYLKVHSLLAADTGTASSLLKRYFPEWRTSAYSLPYVAAVGKRLGSSCLIVASDTSDHLVCVRGTAINASYRIRDRVSVYPYVVPLSAFEPLCM